MSKTEKHEFQAEIAQLLEIVIHSLYTDKEIFVRVERVDDDIEQLLDLGLEFELLRRGGGHGGGKRSRPV